MELKYTDLYDGMGIGRGSVVDVASDLASIILYCKGKGLQFDANDLIDSLKETVTEDGTVLIRTFSWDFCKGKGFDINKSVSRVGALGNVALKRDDFVRTEHPIYSWMVWGKHAGEFAALDNKSSFGKGTVFEALYGYNAIQLSLGNIDGDTEVRTYSMHVRPLNISVHNHEFHEGADFELVKSLGIARKRMYDDTLRCLAFDLMGMQDFITDDLTDNNGCHTVQIDGRPGFVHRETDYSAARY